MNTKTLCIIALAILSAQATAAIAEGNASASFVDIRIVDTFLKEDFAGTAVLEYEGAEPVAVPVAGSQGDRLFAAAQFRDVPSEGTARWTVNSTTGATMLRGVAELARDELLVLDSRSDPDVVLLPAGGRSLQVHAGAISGTWQVVVVPWNSTAADFEAVAWLDLDGDRSVGKGETVTLTPGTRELSGVMDVRQASPVSRFAINVTKDGELLSAHKGEYDWLGGTFLRLDEVMTNARAYELLSKIDLVPVRSSTGGEFAIPNDRFLPIEASGPANTSLDVQSITVTFHRGVTKAEEPSKDEEPVTPQPEPSPEDVNLTSAPEPSVNNHDARILGLAKGGILLALLIAGAGVGLVVMRYRARLERETEGAPP